MRHFRNLAYAFFFCILTYLVLSAFYGDTGMLAYEELQRYNSKLEQNIKELQVINADLENKCRMLQDSENIVLTARSNGMIASDEKLIIIEDFCSSDCREAGPVLGSLCGNQIKNVNRITDISKLRFLSLLIPLLIFLSVKIIFNKNGYRKKSGHCRACVTGSAE